MNITVKDKDIELKFGMRFYRDLDVQSKKTWGKEYTNSSLGFSIGVGVPLLLAGDPIVLADFLYCGTNWMTSGRPRPSDIDDYIDSMSVEDIDAVYGEVVEELKKQAACGKQAIAAEEAMKIEQKRLNS